MSRLRLAYRRLRGMKCVHWPCRRCDRAGRSSWRSREAWHKARRARLIRIGDRVFVGFWIAFVVLVVALAVTR